MAGARFAWSRHATESKNDAAAQLTNVMRRARTLNFQFNSACNRLRTYTGSVRLPEEHPTLVFSGILSLAAALAGLSLWTLSRAHRPIDYMVVGTLATAAGLVAAFVLVLRRKSL
jgi:hypothetical protein